MRRLVFSHFVGLHLSLRAVLVLVPATLLFLAAGCAGVPFTGVSTPASQVQIDLPPVATELPARAPTLVPPVGIAPPLAPALSPASAGAQTAPAQETAGEVGAQSSMTTSQSLVLPTPTAAAADDSAVVQATTEGAESLEAAALGVTEAETSDAPAPASGAFAPLPGTQSPPPASSAGTGSDRFYAAVVPFDTVRDNITLEEIRTQWQGEAPVLTTQDALDLLTELLGPAGAATQVVAPEALIGALESDRTAIGIIPFEQLDPRFKVLSVDGVNLLSNQLASGVYPLIAAGAGSNRDPAKLTTLVMTGVTAMARGTGAAIERAGRTTYPAEIIGPELALADITHVSNEIPFLADCVVRNTENNLVLCSHTSYWDALALMGTDIVGLSGNHVNDFGREGARESLTWYKENDIPIYGSGFTVDEACAPLLWEDHGNTFAFIAALAYGPESAWVTDEEPGACYYYEHKERILNTVRLLSQAVDIVAVELQYEETYFPWPTPEQVTEFRELRTTGADIVTGVQSHVPQAQEPYGNHDAGGAGMISYGLGNLYFDQMWSWETRTELYARHAIYNGKLISTEILTGVLEDYAQPRWTTAEERADLLETIFEGAPERP